MGNIIYFPGVYEQQVEQAPEPELPPLLQEAEHFAQLTQQQQEIEHRSRPYVPSAAQLRMDRIASHALEERIDESVRRLRQEPFGPADAVNNLHMLFAFADARPDNVDILEVAALYTASAYWDANHVSTEYMAPLLRSRISAAAQRSPEGLLASLTMDMVRAVVTMHVTGCMGTQRYIRWHELHQFDLLQFFDDSQQDPDPDSAA